MFSSFDLALLLAPVILVEPHESHKMQFWLNRRKPWWSRGRGISSSDHSWVTRRRHLPINQTHIQNIIFYFSTVLYDTILLNPHLDTFVWKRQSFLIGDGCFGVSKSIYLLYLSKEQRLSNFKLFIRDLQSYLMCFLSLFQQCVSA